MALSNNTRTATYRFKGDALKLQASFKSLNLLKETTGHDPFEFIGECMNIQDADTCVGNIRSLMFCLQADVEHYSEGQIHDWLFGNFVEFFSPENITELAKVISYIMGEDISAAIAAMESSKDTGASEKKGTLASVASTLPTATS